MNQVTIKELPEHIHKTIDAYAKRYNKTKEQIMQELVEITVRERTIQAMSNHEHKIQFALAILKQRYETGQTCDFLFDMVEITERYHCMHCQSFDRCFKISLLKELRNLSNQ